MNQDSVVARLTIELHASGAMSISGNVGDSALASQMLDSAKDAVRNRLKPSNELVVPNRLVNVSQDPTAPYTGMK